MFFRVYFRLLALRARRPVALLLAFGPFGQVPAA
jgi:hypothetical protein